MPVLIAGIIAAVVGAILGVGTAFGLVASQGGGSFPEQNTGSIVVYGSN
jgi:hypothetical protein